MNLNARGYFSRGIGLSIILWIVSTVWCSGEPAVGSHHRTWQTTRETARPDGGVDHQTSSFVQLAGGMNRWDAAAQAWVPASDQVELFQDGAIARNLSFNVIFSPSLADTLDRVFGSVLFTNSSILVTNGAAIGTFSAAPVSYPQSSRHPLYQDFLAAVNFGAL